MKTGGASLFFGALLPLYTELPPAKRWLVRGGCLAGLAGVGSVAVHWLPANLHPVLHRVSAQWMFLASRPPLAGRAKRESKELRMRRLALLLAPLVMAGLMGCSKSDSVTGPPPVPAQWTQVSSGLPSSSTTYALTASGTTLLAGTFGGGVFRSTDGGLTWTAATTPRRV